MEWKASAFPARFRYRVTRPLGDASRFRGSVSVDVRGHFDRVVPEDLLRQLQVSRLPEPPAARTLFQLDSSLSYLGFRVWVTRCPVFRRKGHVPEHRIREHELHSHLRLGGLIFFNVCDNTL